MEPPRGELLSPVQAAEYLGVGERFIRRLIAERRIAYVKVGKYVRIHRGDLDEWIERNRQDVGFDPPTRTPDGSPKTPILTP